MGRDINSQAAYVNAEGALSATAGNNVNIGADVSSTCARDQHKKSDSGGMLATRTVTTDDSSSQVINQGTTFSGNTVVVRAGSRGWKGPDVSSASARDQHKKSDSGGMLATRTVTTDDSNQVVNQRATFSGNTVVVRAGIATIQAPDPQNPGQWIAKASNGSEN